MRGHGTYLGCLGLGSGVNSPGTSARSRPVPNLYLQVDLRYFEPTQPVEDQEILGPTT